MFDNKLIYKFLVALDIIIKNINITQSSSSFRLIKIQIFQYIPSEYFTHVSPFSIPKLAATESNIYLRLRAPSWRSQKLDCFVTT